MESASCLLESNSVVLAQINDRKKFGTNLYSDRLRQATDEAHVDGRQDWSLRKLCPIHWTASYLPCLNV
jgi:hypothetical protein